MSFYCDVCIRGWDANKYVSYTDLFLEKTIEINF